MSEYYCRNIDVVGTIFFNICCDSEEFFGPLCALSSSPCSGNSDEELVDQRNI